MTNRHLLLSFRLDGLNKPKISEIKIDFAAKRNKNVEGRSATSSTYERTMG